MKKALIISALILSSCNSNEKKTDSLFSYDDKTKTLTILHNALNIKTIKIQTEKNLVHLIHIDSNLQITKLENALITPLSKTCINNWYSFDQQMNVLNDYSYYYDTYLSTSHDTIYMNFVALKSIFDGNFYAVTGSFDREFKMKNHSPTDTFRIDNKSIIKIPVLDYRKGANNMRFIVIEEKLKNDTLHQNTTYVDKDFYIK